MSTSARAGETVQSDILRRSLRVLEALAGMEQPAGLLAIAAAVDLSKASAYRVLRTLQEEGYVDHLGRRGYRVGSRSIALASLIGPRPALLQRARPVLSKLAATVHETATLHLRSGEHRVLVLGAEPATNPQRRGVHVGERAPLTSGCSGRVILAHLTDKQAAKVIGTHARGEKRAVIQRELDTIRADGYAMSFSENHPHLNGIGVALLDPDDDYPLGSIVIAGPDYALPADKLRRLAQPLTAACTQLAPHLATVLGPNSSIRLESLDVTIKDFIEAADETDV
ncbi:IclR family transcriptional regulator [Amycolatopsis sp. cmx-8-4]|uniref:IclR family transcriptional regulator n=1 Tax=Amycolatopsis sp. cmx-8-4 TaxID=2790947 RepID=UPI00397BD8DB